MTSRSDFSKLPEIDPTAFVAPGVIIRGAVRIGAGAVIMFGAVIRAELDTIVIGERTNVQDNVVIHCDAGLPTIIGAETTIGHGAIVHGATVGTRCLVGIGAMALNGSNLGDGAWLAAGSILAEGKTIEPGMLAVGIPAKPLRELRRDERERQLSGMEEYLRLGNTYRASEEQSSEEQT